MLAGELEGLDVDWGRINSSEEEKSRKVSGDQGEIGKLPGLISLSQR